MQVKIKVWKSNKHPIKKSILSFTLSLNRQPKMNKNIAVLSVLCSSIAILCINAPARADVGQNSIGPSIQIGGGNTNLGIDSKFGISDNISVRPFIYFPNGGTDFGTALTYDFNLKNTDAKLPITPFVGGSVDVNSNNGSTLTTIGLVGGADFDITDTVRLKAAVIIPLDTSSGQATAVTLGAGYRF
jgi:hypothetical protein